MVKLYQSRKVSLCNKNVCLNVYGKDAQIISAIAVITFMCLAVNAVLKAIK